MVSNLEVEEIYGDENDLDIVSEVFNKDQTKFSTIFSQGGSLYAADKKIDDSLSKLFNCMSKVYAHKLSSPKWNRFLGLKLRWKDKIRLNNLIWRCWHMQFIGGKKIGGIDFVNPLEAENPTKVEGGGTLMMGKYWKRRMDSVLAEYKNWRIYYKSHNSSHGNKHSSCKHVKKTNHVVDDIDLASMISDADLFINAIMTDLETSPFSSHEDWATITNADFIQPGLINLKSQTTDDLCCLQTMYPEAGMRADTSEDYQLIQETIPTTLIQEALPTTLPSIFSNSVFTELSNVSLDVNVPLDSQNNLSQEITILSRDIKPEEPSELANILTGGPGQYILEKRQETSPKPFQTFIQQSSVKQSVIVPTPSVIIDKSLNNPSTSQSPNKKRNLKRKFEERKNSSPKLDPQQSGGSNENFQKLQQLVPGLAESSIKISKAAQLMKAADQIKSLKHENDNLKSEIDLLKASNEDLMKSITTYQNQLSCNGTNISEASEDVKPPTCNLEEMFNDHIRSCSVQNWKYWIFSQLMKPMLSSFEKSGNTKHNWIVL